MKKLIPAIVLLLVSAMLLTTSGYAWFSMNKTVSATGMKFTATAPTSLLISNSGSDGWAATVAIENLWSGTEAVKLSSLTGGVGKIAPISSAKGMFAGTDLSEGTSSFYTVDAINTDGSPKAGAAVTNKIPTRVGTSTTDSAPADGEFVDYVFYIKTSGDTDVKVTVDTTNTKIDYKLSDTNSALYTRVSDMGTGTTYAKDTFFYIDDARYVLDTADSSTEGRTYYKVVEGLNPANAARIAIVEAKYGTNDQEDAMAEAEGLKNVFATANAESNYFSTLVGPFVKAAAGTVSEDAYTAGISGTLAACDNTSMIFTVPGNNVSVRVVVRLWVEGNSTDCVDGISAASFNISLVLKAVD